MITIAVYYHRVGDDTVYCRCFAGPQDNRHYAGGLTLTPQEFLAFKGLLQLACAPEVVTFEEEKRRAT